MSKSMDTKKTIKIPAVKIPPQALRNEGEGSYEGARAYDSDVRDFVKSGSVEAAAKDAEKALDGKEGADLKKAEQAGKRGKA
ncbi:MAG: hypothetical protein ABI321_09935 [Polyangia bacterium]